MLVLAHVVRVHRVKIPELGETIVDLTAALKDKELRELAAKALGYLGPTAKSAVPSMVLVPQTNESEAQALMTALVRIDFKAALPFLIRTLKDENERVSGVAASRLGDIILEGKLSPAETKEVVAALTQAVETLQYQGLDHSAEALGYAGPAAKRAIPALRPHAQHNHYARRTLWLLDPAELKNLEKR